MGLAEQIAEKYFNNGVGFIRWEPAIAAINEALELAAQVADEKALNSVSETADFCAKTIAARIRKLKE